MNKQSQKNANLRWLAIKEQVYKKHSLDFQVIQRDGFICKICGLSCKNDFEIDHLIPKCKGGEDVLENLRMTCRKCNRLKGGK